jgi:hypothetical protein
MSSAAGSISGSITVTYGSQASSTSFGSYKDRPLPLAQTILREMVTGTDRSKQRATYVNLRINSLDDYWNMIVVPNVRDCVREPSQRSVVNAVVATWHVLDWAWHESNYGRDTRGDAAYVAYKKKLLGACPQLGWISDLADTAKHCGLGRTTQSDGLVPLSHGEDRLTFFVMEPFDEQGNLGHLSPIQDVLAIVTNFWLSEFRDRNLPSPFA